MLNVRFEPRRELGRSGFRATAIGIGDVADRALPIDTCVATLRRALDCGLNLVDTAPSYEDGYSEEIVGRALEGRREGVFVVDKIDHLDREVLPQAQESLDRLRMRSVDLFVFHNLSSMETFEKLRERDGGFDQLQGVVRQGLARFRGISSHDPEVLRAAIEADLCDVVMFPLGPFVDERYVSEILPLARSRGVGTVCFKTFGAGKLVADTTGYNQPLQQRPRGKISSGGSDASEPQLPHLAVDECVHYTMTLDPDVTLLGMSFPNEQDAALTAALRFRPLDELVMNDIRQRAAIARIGKGPCWWNPDPDA